MSTSYMAYVDKTTTTVLRAERLAVRYGATAAIDDVALAIEAGEIVAIMGRSGSGKTTLLHVLAGIRLPDAGEVWYRHVRLDSFTDRQRTKLRRTEFGFVFQHAQLIPEMTAVENVALPLLLNGSARGPAMSKAREWLDRLEVAGRADAIPAQLSGGEAQRVAIARAMVIGPSIVFADEPTGSLDSVNAELVMTEFVALADAARTAVVIVTHDPATAAVAGRCVTLSDGRIIED